MNAFWDAGNSSRWSLIDGCSNSVSIRGKLTALFYVFAFCTLQNWFIVVYKWLEKAAGPFLEICATVKKRLCKYYLKKITPKALSYRF